MSGLYGGWSSISQLNFSRSAVVTFAEWSRELSWRSTRHVTFPSFSFEWLVEAVSRCHNVQLALIVEPGGMKSIRRMPFLSQKTEALIFFTEIEVLNFLVWGECVWPTAVTVAWIQGCGEKPMFHLQSQWSPETYLLPVRSA